MYFGNLEHIWKKNEKQLHFSILQPLGGTRRDWVIKYKFYQNNFLALKKKFILRSGVIKQKLKNMDYFNILDNAPAHTALSVRRFLTKKMIWQLWFILPILVRPRPLWLLFIPSNEKGHEGKANVDEVKTKMTKALKDITKEKFKKFYKQ